MYLKSIKINNFRSFLKENNEIKLSEITTIIGKNESGKSNVISALSNLNYSGIKNNNFFNQINKNSNENIVISTRLGIYPEQKKKIKITKIFWPHKF